MLYSAKKPWVWIKTKGSDIKFTIYINIKTD